MTSMLPGPGEYLTTGWERDLDPADSLVREGVDAHVSWARALTTAARGRFVETDAFCAGFGGGASALLNWAIVEAYGPDASAVVVSPFPTPDLAPFGLGLVGHPPFMLRPTSTVTEPPRTTVDVREALD